MPVYLFQLGHQPHLSRAEILALAPQYNFSILKENQVGELLEVETSAEFAAERFIKQLGGTIKIMERLAIAPNPKALATYLENQPLTGKINFSLTGGNFALQIKKELKALDRSVRYIEPKNTATVLHNNLIASASDLTIFERHVYVTRGIQDLEGFSERDYSRPQFDSKSGMLPPKLARMMINLSTTKADEIILDPFCGSGTVLMEASDLGFLNLAGTDLSPKAIQDSEKNLLWLQKKQTIKPSFKLKTADTRRLSQFFPANSIGAIVTEPYMGKPQTGRETKTELVATARELRQLFELAFAEFKIVLRPGGSVVFIIPEFSYQKEPIAVDCLDAIKKLGFIAEPLLPNQTSLTYQRPNQHVTRRIWKFKKPA